MERPLPISIEPLTRSQKLAQRRLGLRQMLWPDLEVESLWNRKTAKGFATVPRTMPLIMVILDSLSVGKPVSHTYLDLWCRMFDECFVQLDKPAEMALAAGFTTSRGIYLWAERLDRLEELKFIRLAPSASNSRGFAVMLNPYPRIKALHDKGEIRDGLYNSLLAHANAVGATDLEFLNRNFLGSP